MSVNKTFEMLKNFAQEIELPKFYKEDVELDRKILAKYGDVKYVWLLRECGSLLFPLKIGANPYHLTFYIRNDSTARFFLVEGFSDVQPKEISKEKAEKLANELPIDFGLISCQDDLINKVGAILSNRDVTTNGFVTPDLEVLPVTWRRWLDKYVGKNDVMEKVMRRAIDKLTSMQNKQSARA